MALHWYIWSTHHIVRLVTCQGSHSTVLQCHLLEELRKTNKLFCSVFKNCFQHGCFLFILSSLENTAPLQHWSSVNSTRTTSVQSTMNTELFMTGLGQSQRCLFSWAQRSTLSPQEHKSTRYWSGPAAFHCPILWNAKKWSDQIHFYDDTYDHTFSFCNLFSLWRTKYYKSTENTKK